jgi:Indole-3-glycerol phosphate synthase
VAEACRLRDDSSTGASRYIQAQMRGGRRFSEAISEGDGISVIVDVADPESARRAEADGAEAIALRTDVAGVRDATELPILWLRGGPVAEAVDAGADACLVRVEGLEADDGRLEALQSAAREFGLACVVDVRSADELRLALDRIDPEVFFLSSREGDGNALECVLELLEDVPAGKLAVADLRVASRADVAQLERAGVDAVIVAPGNVAELVGAAPPDAV